MSEQAWTSLGPRAGSFAVARATTATVVVVMLFTFDLADRAVLGAIAVNTLAVVMALVEVVIARRRPVRFLDQVPIVATFALGLVHQVAFHGSTGGALLLGFSIVEIGMRWRRLPAIAGALVVVAAAVRYPNTDTEPSVVNVTVLVTMLLLAGIFARARFEYVLHRDLEHLRTQFRLEAVTSNIPSAIFVCGDDGSIDLANPGFWELVGDLDGAWTDPFWGRVHPDDVAAVEAATADPDADEYEVRFRFRAADGRYRPVLARATREDRHPHHWVGVIQDLSALDAVRVAESELAAVVRATSDQVLTWAVDGRLVYANAAASRAFDLPRDLSTVDVGELFDDGGSLVLHGPVGHLLEHEGSWSGELVMRTTDGRRFPVLQTLVAHHDGSGRVDRISMIGRDVSGFRAREEHLLHLVHHDPLTGLANRLGLLDVLDESKLAGRPFALLYLDLDDFKAINDAHGHPIGDEILLAVAGRLRAAVRPDDHAARVGGDEFVVVCADVRDTAGAERMAARLRAAVEAEPVTVSGQREIAIRVSVGSALSTEVEVAGLIERADAAMYIEKRRTRQR